VFFVFRKQSGCDHNQMIQQWQKTQRLQSFLWSFSLSHRKELLYKIFCNILLKINIYIFQYIIVFVFNFWWITKNFFKVYRFYQIFHFVSKNNPNFELSENMLTILYFIFLYHKLQLCFRCHVHYTHLHVVKDFWNLKILFNRFNFFLNFKFHNFQIVSVFWMWVIN
jgi:hypothetical protein